MYNNIGSKIKGLAKFFGWLSLIGGAVAFAIICADDGIEKSWYYLAIGFVGFLSSWPLCGFGELIEKVQIIAKQTEKREPSKAEREKEVIADGGWKCVCGRVNANYISSCACGRNRREGDVSKQ